MAKFKVGDKVKWADQPNGKVHTVTATLSSGEVRIDGESMEFPESSFKAANSTSTNPVVQNALAARNAQHFHGDADALAQKIALQYNKWADASEKRKDDEFNKLNTLIRTASSLGGGVWVMRDGTIVIVKSQPRGAKPISDFL